MALKDQLIRCFFKPAIALFFSSLLGCFAGFALFAKGLNLAPEVFFARGKVLVGNSMSRSQLFLFLQDIKGLYSLGQVCRGLGPTPRLQDYAIS